MEQDLAQEIHDNIAKDKKSKNDSQIKEKSERKIGAIDKLRHKDELVKAEIEFLKAQNKLIDGQSIDFDSKDYLEAEYAKIIAYGEVHKTENTPFATFYRNIKLIESLLDKGTTKKLIEKERKIIEGEVEEQKNALSLKTKDRTSFFQNKTKELEAKTKEVGQLKPKRRLSSIETGRALHKLDNLVDEVNKVRSNELQNDIADGEI